MRRSCGRASRDSLVPYDIFIDGVLTPLEFVGWLCPCHRRVIRPIDGEKPQSHLISKDEKVTKCNISPNLWQRTYVEVSR